MSAAHRPGRLRHPARLVAPLLCLVIALPMLPFQSLPASGAASLTAGTGSSRGASVDSGRVVARAMRGLPISRRAHPGPGSAITATNTPGGAMTGAVRRHRLPILFTHIGHISASASAEGLTAAPAIHAGAAGASGYAARDGRHTGPGPSARLDSILRTRVAPPAVALRTQLAPLVGAGTVTVDTTSTVVDGNTSSVSALLAIPGRTARSRCPRRSPP